MNPTTRQLLLDIAHCVDVGNCLNASTAIMHPCYKVVTVQEQEYQASINYQVPEPWSGDLENAPLLFVSSNPSIGNDVYPLDNWKGDCIVDFFQNRFSAIPPTCCVASGIHLAPWSQANSKGGVTRNLLLSGVYGNVAYWSSILARAKELMGPKVTPGQDYAITEVVHCKSKKEKGVANAQVYCMEEYFSRILCCSQAKVIIVVGSIARRAIQCAYKILLSETFEQSELCGRARIVIAIPHPNSFGGGKTLSSCFDNKKISQIKEALGNGAKPA